MFHRVMRLKLVGPRGVKNLAIVDVAKPRDGMWAKNLESQAVQTYLKDTLDGL
jgi:hypothetical protein